MKCKVIIEEVISQEFIVDFKDGEDMYKKVHDMYHEEKLMLDNPSLTQAVCNICDKDGHQTEWQDLHV